MLSGEGNAGERWKTTTGLISEKSNFARAAHFFCTFLCRCFARLLRETSRNFVVTFYGGNVARFLVQFFFTAAHFHLALVAASQFLILSPPLQNFHVVIPTKKMSPLFFYRSLLISVALLLVELRWPAAYFLFFSVSLLLYIPNLWTWQLI